MQRPLLVIATCGALSLTTGAVSAQTSLTLYGIVDAGVVYERGGPAGNLTKLTSGVQSGSRLGFKGMEDLGGGLAAKFNLETGFNTDTGGLGQGGLLFGRQAWVGLGGRWGDLSFGRQYTPHYELLDQVDPFATGLAGNAANLTSTTPRMNNTIKLATPDWSGVSGELAYGFGEVPGNNTANRQLGASLGYARGPLMLKIAHHRIEDGTGSDNARSTLIGGKFDFGMAAASLGVGLNHGAGGTDNRDYMLGVTVPVGAGAVLASFTRKDDRSGLNAGADQWALGYTHALSRRTNVYTSFARIYNDPGAGFTAGNASEPGSGDKAFNIGIRHKF
ncbi:porin [Noviherbaspirillum denitrificans]|uniref:Porin n=1 Tax=Noviherbaspirillum denitrificans TaxID=1968433 RepID=A0A254TC64_9BURK|nr:porin [Noviherbaspirillum denitrificans]OWW18872.1 porin [Noviherbaspirillum denitrificans]